MTLRLGLLVDTLTVPAWIARLAERLAALDGVQVALLVDAGKSPSAPTAVLGGDASAGDGASSKDNKFTFHSTRILDAYLALERRFLHNVPDLSSPSNLRAVLPNVLIVSAEDVQKIQSQRLDVLLGFGGGDFSRTARLGQWTWNDISRETGFRDVLERTHLMTCSLVAQLPTGENKVLRRAVFATDWLSAARNRNHVYIKASSTLLWALKKLVLKGEEKFFAGLEEFHREEAKTAKIIGIREVGSLALKQMARALEKKFRPRETWMLLAGKSAGGLVPDSTASRSIVPPRGAYWADPMAVERAGRVHVFVEEYIRKVRRGRIVCLTLDDDGRVASQQVALEQPYHLSYPFIFEHRGESYMLPETASRRAIELYHCTRWPDRWEFAGALMSGVYAVDATLLEHGGRWWLFTNLMTETGASSWDELHLFFADDPLSSKWTPHPLNPVVSDVRTARPAGPFFTFEGNLYRPSQDSSRRYGGALNLNRVLTLTERDYAETRIETIPPPHGLLTTHTYSRAGGWVFMDGATRKTSNLLTSQRNINRTRIAKHAD